MLWRTRDPLAREEWDFRAMGESGWYDEKKYGPFNFLPDDEVNYCRLYEFSRFHPDADGVVADRNLECPAWVTWAEATELGRKPRLSLEERKRLTEATFDALLKYRWSLVARPIKTKLEFLFSYCWPEWPMQPFLSVNPAERKRRYKLSWPNMQSQQMELVPLQSIIETYIIRSRGGVPKCLPKYNKLDRDSRINKDTWVIMPKIQGSVADPVEITPVAIDYAKSNKVLANEFLELLKRRRKEKGYTERGSNDLKAQTAKLRGELTRMAAARLISVGLTAPEASAHTKRLSGKPLFASPPLWSKAASGMLG